MIFKITGLTYETYELARNGDCEDTKVSEHVSPESTRINISTESLRELGKNSVVNKRQNNFNAQRSMNEAEKCYCDD